MRQDDAPNDPMNETVAQLTEVRVRTAREIGRHQRSIEWFTHLIGRPVSVVAVLVVVVVWVVLNTVVLRGDARLDPAPFFWLQGMVALGALVTSLMVLTTELRQTRHEEERAHLDLQVNLLAERKITKLIALVEELRRDLPNVPHRHDAEAAALAKPVHPATALDTLRETFEAESSEADE